MPEAPTCGILGSRRRFILSAAGKVWDPGEIKKGAASACAAPFSTSTYDFTTSSLFSTVKAPKIWLARIPATCLSIVLSTAP
jgi:hypothetical protein